MKFSIITVVFNNEQVTEAIDSVLSQKNVDIEYIIIDGCSTDRTLDLIYQRKTNSMKIISEKDNGIYDALNKGLSIATGDIIGFLHSDDLFDNNLVLDKIEKAFIEYKCSGIYGDLVYVDKIDTNKVIRNWKSRQYTNSDIKRGWMPPHPTFFVKKSIYELLGGFNTEYRISADYDNMLKFFLCLDFKATYIPLLITRMRIGGESNKSFWHIIKKMKEDIKIMKIYNLPWIYSILYKNISKVIQFSSLLKKNKMEGV